ncbi:RNA polymerase sigma-54 factor [Sphingomonas antarctica]|uniref:RNA polymerase factor sigma-54 n=1 Tax=Sphingomonas antarctica TaxID=2040274 RepID=UPI0039E92BFD
MSLGPRLDIRATQSLAMTPQLQQAIHLLTLTNVELAAAVAEEIERNPMLIVDDGGGEAAARHDTQAESTESLVDHGDAATDAPLDLGWSEETVDHASRLDSPAGDDGFDFDQLACAEGSLCDHLGTQAGEILDGVDLLIARQIIDCIDDAGYLAEPLGDIAARLKISTREADKVLEIIQGFDPVGVGARTLAECLELQAKAADRYDPCMATLIANLDLLAAGRIAQLQRLCNADDEDMADMIRELRGYDPKPGLRFGTTRTETVEPDLFVVERGGKFTIEINQATLPTITLDQRYGKGLPDNAKTKAWLSECATGARWLLGALEQRRKTLLAVAGEVVKHQQDFFRHGVASLRPLTMTRVAEVVEMHESTVSRAASGKYLGTPLGTFELRYFFVSGVATDDGEAASATAVKAAIKVLIAAEKPNAILSDDTLVDLLKAQGFDLARRTVAKYREAIGLGSSIQRRRAAAIAGNG